MRKKQEPVSDIEGEILQFAKAARLSSGA